MKKDTLRVYVTVGGVIWEIYKIWIEKGSFYYTFSPKHKGFNTKFTHHPFEKQKWGLIHTKQNEPGTQSHEQGRMTVKTGWPGFKELEIVPIDSYGFETKDFVNDGTFLRKLKRDSAKQPQLMFDISDITPAFCLRIFLSKTQLLNYHKVIEDKITSGGAEQVLQREVYNFQEFSVEDHSYKLSCIVCLIGMEHL